MSGRRREQFAGTKLRRSGTSDVVRRRRGKLPALIDSIIIIDALLWIRLDCLTYRGIHTKEIRVSKWNLLSIPREEFAIVFHPEPIKDCQQVTHALFACEELPLRHIALQHGR